MKDLKMHWQKVRNYGRILNKLIKMGFNPDNLNEIEIFSA